MLYLEVPSLFSYSALLSEINLNLPFKKYSRVQREEYQSLEMDSLKGSCFFHVLHLDHDPLGQITNWYQLLQLNASYYTYDDFCG